MANTLLTMKNIAREALPILVENLVFPNLVHTDYSKDFVNKGDTIQIEKPPVFEAKDFETEIEIQDANFGKVEVTIDTLADVSTSVTSKELALDMADFMDRVGEPMAKALAEKINREGLELAKDIPYFSGVAGETPDDLEDFAAIRKGLNTKNVPTSPRNAIWNVDADTEFTKLAALVKANESGDVKALREGSIGRVYGMDNYYAQSVYEHVAGGAVSTTSPKVKGAVAEGALVMAIDATTMTGNLVKGDIFTIAGATYVVTADTAAASSNAINVVNFYPAIPAGGIADNAAVVFADAATGKSVRNMGFHPNAFAFVSRAMPLPSNAKAYITTYNGITLRVVQAYDAVKKKEILSMDVLYGFKTIYPELAQIRLG